MKLLSRKTSVLVLAVYLPLLILNALVCRALSLSTDLNMVQEIVAIGIGMLCLGYIIFACISIYCNRDKVQE